MNEAVGQQFTCTQLEDELTKLAPDGGLSGVGCTTWRMSSISTPLRRNVRLHRQPHLFEARELFQRF